MSKSRKYLLGLLGLLVLIIGYAVVFGERYDETSMDCDAEDISEEDSIECIVNQIDGTHFGDVLRLDLIGNTIQMVWRVSEYPGFTDDAYEDIVRVVCVLMDAGYTDNRFYITARAPHPTGDGDMAMIAVLTNESAEGMACRLPRAVELQNYTIDYDLKWIP